jgi:hypothetical protein
MSWWKSATEQKREVQIESLERAFPHARKKVMEQDNSCEYDIDFVRGEGLPKATLRVFLPRKFPSDKPILLFRSDIDHPWINQYNQVVGHPYWTKWDKDNMDVAMVVLEVITELTIHTLPSPPPNTMASPARPPVPPKPSKPISPPQYNQVSTSQSPPNYPQQPQQQQQQQQQQLPTHHTASSLSLAAAQEEEEETFEIPTPEVQKEFKDLEKLATEELERLYNDEVALHNYVSNLPGVNTMQEILADALHANFKVATLNLAKKEELNKIRNDCSKLQLEVKECKEQFDLKLNGYLEKEKSRSSDTAILSKMRLTSSRIDERSDRLHDRLLNKEMEVCV